MRELIVIGGGITGLASAYLATRAGIQVTVLEASDAVGGLLATFEVGGNRLEWFYHHAFTHDAELRWLLRELGIEDRLEFRKSSMGVFRNGRSFDFNSPKDLLRFTPLRFIDKARFTASSLYLAYLADWRACERVSALDWFNLHAGRRTTECLWEPLLRVKFGPYASQTPLSWMVGRMRQRVTSRQRGEEKLGYLRGSLHELLQALLRELARLNVRILTGCPAEALETRGGEMLAVRTPHGRFQADAFLFTIPTTHMAELVAPADAAYAAQLRQIEYFGAICTVLELRRSLLPVYWLNIADPGYPFGGIIEHTRLVPPSEYGGAHLIYLSRYFAASDDLARMTASQVQQVMLDGLKKAVPAFTEADVINVRLFSSRTAAVVCDLNYSRKVPACRSPLKRLFVASMPHIYPDERSCNNSIRVAAEACRVLGLATPEVPSRTSLSGQINMV